MKLSTYIIDILKHTKCIFGYTGGSIADIIDSLTLNGEIKYIQNYHEQASAFAANGYSMVSDEVGIACASGGPGACNLINGIANAYYDNIPCLFITGNVHTLAMRKTKSIRQNAFQETDIVSVVSDITKYAVKIENKNDIKYEIEKAFYIANEGRKGPVLLDIPYNIAREEINLSELREFVLPEKKTYDEIDVLKIKEILSVSKRPLILVGGGMRSNLCRAKLKKLEDKLQIPVVASLCGLDIFPHDHKQYVGFIGHYGNRYANLAIAHCDCLIVLGSRLDERQLGGYRTRLLPDTKVIRVDVDKNELGRKIPETLSIYSTCENFLDKMLENNFYDYDFSVWQKIINTWKKQYPSSVAENDALTANHFIDTISDYLPKDAVICSDVGQNQMCVAQAIKLDGNRRLLNSAGYGSMGFSLPAAIGAAYATNKKTMILSVNGDGGIQMNIQELQTLKRDQLPVNIIVLNNKCLGMIRKTQEKLYEGRYSASVEGYEAPDFEAIAKAYNIPYLHVMSVDDYSQVQAFLSNESPRFIEVSLPIMMENNPEPGDFIDKQNPLLSEDEMNLIKKECEF